MSDVTLQRLKDCQLSMLRAFIAICEKHNLTYFLIGGTALGAVRHNGFIPWDDDIDVALPREDYEKFLAVAQADLPEGLFLQTSKTDPEYMTCFSKIRDSRTTFWESSAKHLDINHGIFIDIFVLDGCEDYDLYEKKARFLKIRTLSRYKFKRSFKEKIGCILAALRYPSAKSARDRLMALWKEIPYATSEYVVSYGGAYGKKEVLPKEIFGEGSEGTFEGLTVRLPAKIDEYLTRIYGDYMQLPPEEKRIAHHFCEVIDPNTPYTEYTKKKRK